MRSDAELVRAILDGETEAFGDLASRHKHSVYGLALSYLKDFEAAYDVSQEVFLRAFLKLRQLRNPGKGPSWLRSITANTCKSWLRNQKENVPIESLDQEDSIPIENPRPDTPEEMLERQEKRRVVLASLSKLSETNRQAVTLHYIDGLSAPEIASFLDVPPQTIRQRIRRARAQLKKEILKMVEEIIQTEAPGDQFEKDVSRLLEEAKRFFARAEYQGAIPLLQQASLIAPEDSAVSLILADAYTHGKTLEEYLEDPEPHNKAKKILEALVKREPRNIAARILLAEHRSVSGRLEDLVDEHEKNLQLARRGPFEAWALLRLARVYAPRKRHEEALAHYRKVIELEPRLAGVVYRDMAVSHYLNGDIPEAIANLKEAIKALENQTQKALAEYFRQLLGDPCWRFWEHADDRLVFLCQDHGLLAGLYMKVGETEQTEGHLDIALGYLNREELAWTRKTLVEELLRLSETEFPELAKHETIQGLSRDARETS